MIFKKKVFLSLENIRRVNNKSPIKDNYPKRNFNSASEEFEFSIATTLTLDKYRLYVYNISIEKVKQNPDADFIGLYEITVTEPEIMCYMYIY